MSTMEKGNKVSFTTRGHPTYLSLRIIPTLLSPPNVLSLRTLQRLIVRVSVLHPV